MNAPNSPAFPCPGAEGVNPESLGMSLRVYAAIEAMKALVITLRPEVDEMGRILPSQWRPIVSGSYKLADEMIREGVAALTPAPTQEPPAGVSPWQPIETAPRDRLIWLLYPAFGAWLPSSWKGCWSYVSNQWNIATPYALNGKQVYCDEKVQPTHWMDIQPAGGVTTEGSGA